MKITPPGPGPSPAEAVAPADRVESVDGAEAPDDVPAADAVDAAAPVDAVAPPEGAEAAFLEMVSVDFRAELERIVADDAFLSARFGKRDA